MALSGCGLLLETDLPSAALDGGMVDVPVNDGGSRFDAIVVDARVVDAPAFDAAPPDAGPPEAGPLDAGPVDAGPVWIAWSTTLGGPGDERAEALDIRQDAPAYEVLLGLDGVSFPPRPPPPVGTGHVLIVQYTPDGVLLESRDRSYGSVSWDNVWSVVAAPAGRTFECGQLGGFVRFGSADVDGGYVVARDASGTTLWARNTAGPICKGAAALPGGGVVAVSHGGILSAVEAFNAVGETAWSRQLGDADDDAVGVSTTADGDVFVTGTFMGVLMVGASPIPSAGVIDSFVARYTGDGDFVWSYRFGGVTIDKSEAITLDPSGNVLAVGWFQGTFDVAGSPVTSAGGDDLFVLSLTGDGEPRWARRFGGPSTDRAFAVSTDASGNVYVTGFFRGTTDFGEGPVTTAGAGSYVLSLTAEGTLRWVLPLVGDDDVRGWAIAAAPDGSIWVAGEFRGTTSFATPPLISAGGSDAFLIKLVQASP